mgnify:CR=1 FL=1
MGPQIILHERTGQPRSCLRGLVTYAGKIASSRLTGRFESPKDVRDWIWGQPILLDDGKGVTEPGCVPAQRSRIWPKSGLNCWEATAHWLGWHLRNQSPIEVHLFDLRVRGQRHVFPAATYLDDSEPPLPIVLQPPYGRELRETARTRLMQLAQALGPLPPPLQLVRSVSFFIDLDPGHFVTEVGGDASRAYRGPLPETVLQRLPPAWRDREFFLWPTAGGDLLFLVVERPFFLAEATAYIVRIPASALSGAAETRSSSGSSPAGSGSLPAGAPPANCWDGFPLGSRWITPAAQQLARANAVENDVLGGVHLVGDKVLRVFGLGSVSDQLAMAEGDALPDFALSDEQRKARQAKNAPAPRPAVPINRSEVTPAAPDADAEQQRLDAQQRAAHIEHLQQLTQEVYRQQAEQRRLHDEQLELAAQRRLAEQQDDEERRTTDDTFFPDGELFAAPDDRAAPEAASFERL